MPELILIIGPCGAGKTTYAREHYPKHLHVDYERLIQSLFATPKRFRFYPYVRTCGALLFDTAASHLIAKRQHVCLTLRGATRKERMKYTDMAFDAGMDVHCIRLMAPPETCIARANADILRPVSSRPSWQEIVEHWFRDFEPVDFIAENMVFYQEIDNR